jgi:hypothetical protein
LVKKGMSFERVANVVDIYLNRLPFLESLHEQISRAVSRKENDYLDNLIFTLEEEVKIIKKEPPSSYNCVEDMKNPANDTYSNCSPPR